MFWNLIRAEHRKLFKRRLFWAEVGILALLTVVVNAGLITFMHMPESATSGNVQFQGTLPDTPAALLSMVTTMFAGGGNLLGLLIIPLVGALVAQEYTWRTVHLWLSRGVSRTHYLLAKLFTVLTALLVFIVTPLVLSIPFVFYTVPEAGGSVSMTPTEFQQLLMNALQGVYVLLPYVVLTLLLAVATQSTVAAIGTAIGVSVIGEPLLNMAGMFSAQMRAIVAYLPRNLAQVLMSANAEMAQQAGMGAQRPSPTMAAGALAAWILVFLVGALWQFRRQDIA